MKFLAIIPSRYASSRFPGKPLALLGGKPVVQHVYESARQVFDNVCVATDDERIADFVRQFGGTAVMTSPLHRSGTDRSQEAFVKGGIKADVIVNIQGDEPFITAEQLNAVKHCFNDPRTEIATLVQPFKPEDGWTALSDPNSPKVVIDNEDYAIYFSRSVIPYLRGVEQDEWLTRHTFYKHIGLYAYKADVLEAITQMPQGQLEKAESLEQLRWLEAGLHIKVGYTHTGTIGIDTPQDLERAERELKLRRAAHQK